MKKIFLLLLFPLFLKSQTTCSIIGTPTISQSVIIWNNNSAIKVGASVEVGSTGEYKWETLQVKDTIGTIKQLMLNQLHYANQISDLQSDYRKLYNLFLKENTESLKYAREVQKLMTELKKFIK